MSAQPDDLRLVDALLDGMGDEYWDQLRADAAAALCRLHAENDALRAALAEHQESLTFETAAEAKADREHAEAYYRQAEHLLTSNEQTLHAEIARLKAQLAEQPAEQEPEGNMTPTQRKAMEQALEALWTSANPKAEAAIAALRAALAEQPAEQEPVALDHIACICDGELRYMSGRKAPAWDCELYAVPGGKAAPKLYTAPQPIIPPGYKLTLKSVDELAAELYAQHPTYRGADLLPWRDAPQAARREWLDKASAMLAAAPEAPQPAKRVPGIVTGPCGQCGSRQDPCSCGNIKTVAARGVAGENR